MTDISEPYELEHKDRGIILFQGASDHYDADTDPGFVEINRDDAPICYAESSAIEADSLNMHQSIFDRLPIPQSKRADFYNWLVTDFAEQQAREEQEESAAGPPQTPRAHGKKRIRVH
jgi:hypothetical protein